MKVTTPKGEVLELTPGTIKRTVEASKRGSDGVPPEFENSLLWAADWVKRNGMTLPPKGPKTDTLRAWFCYQLQKWKSNKLSEKKLVEFALLGIDFSQYRALNTGKGEREPDEKYVELLKRWVGAKHTFNLDSAADKGLIAWQKKILDRFAANGSSKRLKGIEESVPGLQIGLWLKPGESNHSPEFLGWWAKAEEFRKSSVSTPSFRGNLHPGLSPDLADWARKQQKDANSWKHSWRQRGLLLDLEIIFREGEREISKQREYVLGLANERNIDDLARGETDRRLNTFYGAALLARLLHNKSTDQKLMVEFAINPAGMLQVRDCAKEFLPTIMATSFVHDMGACRTLHRSYPFLFHCLAEGTDHYVDLHGVNEIVKTTGVMLYQLHRKLEALEIIQDLVEP